MYQDDYYPAFLVDKVKDKLQKVIDLLEGGETDIEVIQNTLDEAVNTHKTIDAKLDRLISIRVAEAG